MINGVGVIVRRDGKYLIGRRADGQGWCGGGGHIEEGESPRKAARRELLEEFGVEAILKKLGTIRGIEQNGNYESVIYLAEDFYGEPRVYRNEMDTSTMVSPDELKNYKLFEPFEQSLTLLESL